MPRAHRQDRECMYLRFVVTDTDDDSERALGVFHAVRYLRDEGKLYPYEEDQHDMVRWWFNENLERPARFTVSKAPFYRKKNAYNKLPAAVRNLFELFSQLVAASVLSVRSYVRASAISGIWAEPGTPFQHRKIRVPVRDCHA